MVHRSCQAVEVIAQDGVDITAGSPHRRRRQTLPTLTRVRLGEALTDVP
jgi:hypothetical protein